MDIRIDEKYFDGKTILHVTSQKHWDLLRHKFFDRFVGLKYVTGLCIVLGTATYRSLHCSFNYINDNPVYFKFNIVTSDEVLNIEPIYDVW